MLLLRRHLTRLTRREEREPKKAGEDLRVRLWPVCELTRADRDAPNADRVLPPDLWRCLELGPDRAVTVEAEVPESERGERRYTWRDPAGAALARAAEVLDGVERVKESPVLELTARLTARLKLVCWRGRLICEWCVEVVGDSSGVAELLGVDRFLTVTEPEPPQRSMDL